MGYYTDFSLQIFTIDGSKEVNLQEGYNELSVKDFNHLKNIVHSCCKDSITMLDVESLLEKECLNLKW